MPNDSERSISYTPEFKRNLRILAKSYRSIRTDITPLLEQLESGELPGDRVQHTQHLVYKVRVPNSDAQRGKSCGYRVIYYLNTSTSVVLITIYSKLEQGDISSEAIRNIIDEYKDV
jgi:mRNA-degrading endonuclease RelE of RelBE toxin-antitoxin system